MKRIFKRFRKVMTVELNYSDDADDPFVHRRNRRHAQLARIMRNNTLIDVDCWSRVPGVPLRPGRIERVIRRRLGQLVTEETT